MEMVGTGQINYPPALVEKKQIIIATCHFPICSLHQLRRKFSHKSKRSNPSSSRWCTCVDIQPFFFFFLIGGSIDIQPTLLFELHFHRPTERERERERERDGLANAIPSGGGVLGDRSDILAGDLRIAIGRSEFDEVCNLSQAGSSSVLLHGLWIRSLGHLHRRHHNVQVPLFSPCPLLLLCHKGRAWLPRRRNYMFSVLCVL
jgi:hypothetical protein